MPAAIALSSASHASASKRNVAADGADFEMTSADFEEVRALIYEHAGITLSSAKKAMVYSRLARRLRETGHGSFHDYLRELASLSGDAAAQERQHFVNCLTTNLTAFFREAHHFPVLADALKHGRGAPQRIWCNAASTGEEPYSLAITVADAVGLRSNVDIVASDIDTNVLATAKRGVYPVDSRGLSPECRREHFFRGTGANAGMMRIKPEVARLVDFRYFNLMDERWSLGEPFDIVFCRNVMIYFDAGTQQRVLERMHRAMKPGSLLFAGHSENFGHSRQYFRLKAQTVYERV